MKTKLIALAALGMLALTSCKDEKPDPPESKKTILFEVVLTDGTNRIYEGDNISLQNGYDINISLFRLFLSDIKLISSDGQSTEVKDVVLVDPGSQVTANNTFEIQTEGKKITSLYFGLGVNAEQNAMDPADFPNEHPLSSYQAMYWTMLKYRFAKFEGHVNLSGQMGNNDILVALHPGTDPLYKTTELPINLDISHESTGGGKVIIEINLVELLAGANAFNWSLEAQTHSETTAELAIADKFMTNLKNAITAEAHIPLSF